MRKITILSLFLIFACNLFGQDYDYTKKDFNIISNQFELIKWKGLDRNAQKKDIITKINLSCDSIHFKNKDIDMNFKILSKQFDGIDKNIYTCSDGIRVRYIPGIYISFTEGFCYHLDTRNNIQYLDYPRKYWVVVFVEKEKKYYYFSLFLKP